MINVQQPVDEGKVSLEKLRELFGPSFNGAYIELPVTYSAPSVQRLFNRDFVYMSRAVYRAESNMETISYLEFIHSRRDASEVDVEGHSRVQDFRKSVVDSLKLFETKMAKLEQYLTLSRTSLQKLIAQNDVASTAYFARPVVYKAIVISPIAKRFLDLLHLLDDYMALSSCAALNGLIDTERKMKDELRLRDAVRAFTAMVRVQRSVMMKKQIAANERTTDTAMKAEIDSSISTERNHLASEAEQDPTLESTPNEFDGSNQGDTSSSSRRGRRSASQTMDGPVDQYAAIDSSSMVLTG